MKDCICPDLVEIIVYVRVENFVALFLADSAIIARHIKSKKDSSGAEVIGTQIARGWGGLYAEISAKYVVKVTSIRDSWVIVWVFES